MNTATSTLLAIGTCVLSAIVLLLLRDWFRRSPHLSPAQAASDKTAYLEALRTPRWPEIEAALGRPIPTVLKDLYSDYRKLDGQEFYVFDPSRPQTEDEAWRLAFCPATQDCLTPAFEMIPHHAFAFASNQFGDPYYVRLSATTDGDGPVFLRHHDGGDTVPVAPSLRTFLTWPHRPVVHSRPAT